MSDKRLHFLQSCYVWARFEALFAEGHQCSCFQPPPPPLPPPPPASSPRGSPGARAWELASTALALSSIAPSPPSLSIFQLLDSRARRPAKILSGLLDSVSSLGQRVHSSAAHKYFSLPAPTQDNPPHKRLLYHLAWSFSNWFSLTSHHLTYVTLHSTFSITHHHSQTYSLSSLLLTVLSNIPDNWINMWDHGKPWETDFTLRIMSPSCHYSVPVHLFSSICTAAHMCGLVHDVISHSCCLTHLSFSPSHLCTSAFLIVFFFPLTCHHKPSGTPASDQISVRRLTAEKVSETHHMCVLLEWSRNKSSCCWIKIMFFVTIHRGS